MPRLSLYRKNEMKKTIGFATWTLYGTACVFVRTQGLAVILNRFYGTIINASYGIGAQIFGSIQFLSEAIIHAIRPQITKAEGRGERKKMLSMSLKTCKCCYLIMAIVTIPLLVEMDSVLTFWLGKVPYNATLFCRIMLLAALIDQITIGLNVANTAIGRIRNFTIFVFTTKALAVPVGLSLLKYGYGIHSVMYSYLFFEVLSGIIRVPYLKRNAGLAIADYFEQVLLKISVPTICMFTVCLCISQYCHLPLRFIISGIVNGVTGVIIMYLTATTSEERHLISNYIYEHFYRNK